MKKAFEDAKIYMFVFGTDIISTSGNGNQQPEDNDGSIQLPPDYFT